MLLYIENLGSSISPNNFFITALSLPGVSANKRSGFMSSVTTLLKNLSICGPSSAKVPFANFIGKPGGAF